MTQYFTQVLTLGNDQDQQPFFQDWNFIKQNKAPKEDEETFNAISKGVRKLSTMFTIFSVRESKNSQVQVTKRLFTHFGRSLSARIGPLKCQHPTGKASQRYRNLFCTGEELEKKTS